MRQAVIYLTADLHMQMQDFFVTMEHMYDAPNYVKNASQERVLALNNLLSKRNSWHKTDQGKSLLCESCHFTTLILTD